MRRAAEVIRKVRDYLWHECISKLFEVNPIVIDEDDDCKSEEVGFEGGSSESDDELSEMWVVD